MEDIKYIELAIEQARKSVAMGGFPAGAVLVIDNKIIGEGVSVGNIICDPTAHGEIDSIRKACDTMNNSNLESATLYTSMETCGMCLNAVMWAGISRIVYALGKDKVSNLYYGGEYITENINNTFLKPIEIYHLKQKEEESLVIVKEWEEKSNEK